MKWDYNFYIVPITNNPLGVSVFYGYNERVVEQNFRVFQDYYKENVIAVLKIKIKIA